MDHIVIPVSGMTCGGCTAGYVGDGTLGTCLGSHRAFMHDCRSCPDSPRARLYYALALGQ